MAFVISWTPYAIVSFYTVFASPHQFDTILTRTAAWFAKTEVILNPLIYALLNKSFREKLVCCSAIAVVATQDSPAADSYRMETI